MSLDHGWHPVNSVARTCQPPPLITYRLIHQNRVRTEPRAKPGIYHRVYHRSGEREADKEWSRAHSATAAARLGSATRPGQLPWQPDHPRNPRSALLALSSAFRNRRIPFQPAAPFAAHTRSSVLLCPPSFHACFFVCCTLLSRSHLRLLSLSLFLSLSIYLSSFLLPSHDVSLWSREQSWPRASSDRCRRKSRRSSWPPGESLSSRMIFCVFLYIEWSARARVHALPRDSYDSYDDTLEFSDDFIVYTLYCNVMIQILKYGISYRIWYLFFF